MFNWLYWYVLSVSLQFAECVIIFITQIGAMFPHISTTSFVFACIRYKTYQKRYNANNYVTFFGNKVRYTCYIIVSKLFKLFNIHVHAFRNDVLTSQIVNKAIAFYYNV